MKKTVLTAAIAVILSAGISAPAQAAGAADTKYSQAVEAQSVSKSLPQSEIDKFTSDPVRYLLGLLLPAVQQVREG